LDLKTLGIQRKMEFAYKHVLIACGNSDLVAL